MEDCKWCHREKGDDSCCDSKKNYACTRVPGHDGPHVACALTEHALAAWDDEGNLVDISDGKGD